MQKGRGDGVSETWGCCSGYIFPKPRHTKEWNIQTLCSLPTSRGSQPHTMDHETRAGWGGSQLSLTSVLVLQGSPGQTGESWQGRPRAFTSSSHQMCFQRNSASLITRLPSIATHGSQEVSPYAQGTFLACGLQINRYPCPRAGCELQPCWIMFHFPASELEATLFLSFLGSTSKIRSF